MIGVLIYIGVQLLTESASMHFLDLNEAFCGSALPEELYNLCMTYNLVTPDELSYIKHSGVVEECCQKRCSRRYLMENYCNQSKSFPDLENIYGEVFKRNFAPPHPTTVTFRLNALENKLEKRGRRGGCEKVARKRSRCVCRQRRAKKNKSGVRNYAPAMIGAKHRNVMYNWLGAPLHHDTADVK